MGKVSSRKKWDWTLTYKDGAGGFPLMSTLCNNVTIYIKGNVWGKRDASLISFITDGYTQTSQWNVGLLATCLIKLPELFFKFLQSFSCSVALGERHACNKQTDVSGGEKGVKKLKKDAGELLRWPLNFKHTHSSVSSHPRLLKCDLCLCVFYGCASERVCDCDAALTYRCVYVERGGKPNSLTHKEKKPDGRGADQLVNQNLLAHSSHGSASVESVQPLVPEMHAGTQCSTHCKHATFGDTNN